MDAQLAAVAVKVTGDVMDRTAEYKSTHREESTTKNQADTNVFVVNNHTTLTEGQVQMIVQQALSVFMADKTGMVDYALESAGGCVVSTRCSEDYKTGTAQYQIFGIPIYYGSNSPRSVIQPEVHPGNCWAFKGHNGYLVIQLSQTIIPTSFSLEHIPKALSPTGHIDSAPKDFSVWGLKSEHDLEGQELGNFTYNDDGPPIQFFSIEPRNIKPTPIIELKIHSNHGNKDYTCLYRFRVHGTIHRH
ncbi:SUN domain-containing protein 1-like [Lineus longissimus]|uniref:SUN domain-containing protein 1-like n=1 Tax=Lineus longissimus TaxID=88925 RepID=UPI00315D20CE